MPEAFGVVTLHDLLMWAADQGAIAKHSGLDGDIGIPRAQERVSEFVRQAARAPHHLLVPGRGVDFIEFLMTRVSVPEDPAAAAVDDEIRMILDTLINNHGLSVVQGLMTPVSPNADIDYLCRWEIRDTTPPEWARVYFTGETPRGDVPTHTYVERPPRAGHEGADSSHRDGPLSLTVEGEVFKVRPRRGVPGQYDFDWVSGPNEDYGFTSATSDGSPETREGLEDAIRDFLSQIDPETGYVAEDGAEEGWRR